jgi:hypothetical protein
VHIVEVEVVLGVEAAYRQVVTLLAAFAGGEADSGDVAQGVAHGGDALVVQQFAGDLGDGLGCGYKWLAEFAVGGQADLVAALAALGALDGDGRQLSGVALGGLRPGGVQAGAVEQRHPHGGSDHAMPGRSKRRDHGVDGLHG